MAALSITAANVVYQEGPLLHGAIAGEAFIAGALLYKKITDGKWYKAQADGTAAEAGSDGIGMALATADVAGAEVSIALPGAIVAIAASGLAPGIPYYIHTTAGGIGLYSELASTNKVTFCGVTIAATKIKLGYLYDAGAVI